jgi:Tol biopolymer transport system component/C-terminal processing protease CtpA/Prc
MTRLAVAIVSLILCLAVVSPVTADHRAPEGAPVQEGKDGGKLTVSGVRGPMFPALSPSGKQLTFSMYGDIWIAPASGGYARRITVSNAYDTKPRWSPDGRLIAFSSKRSGNYDLWITAVESGSPRQLTFDYAFDSISDWSPDGKFIYFHSNRDGRTNVWRIPAGGGLAQQMTVTGGRDVSVSPRSGEMVFSYGLSDPTRKMYRGSSNWDLYAIQSPGDVPRALTTFEGNDRCPLFSRDGTELLYLSEKNGWYNIFRRNLETGEEKPLTQWKGDDVRMPHLSRDGSSVVYVTRDAVWRTDLATGTHRQIALTINADLKGPIYTKRTITVGAEQPSWSPDGKKIAFQLRGDIWVMPAEGGSARQLTSGSAIDEWPRFSPDGRSIAFFSDRSGNKDIWMMSASGGRAVQITSHAKDDFFHDFSPDGRTLVFCSDRSGNKDIWTIDVKTRRTRQLTRNPKADDDPVFSPDGRWIAFDSGRTGQQNIYLMRSDGSGIVRRSSGRFDQIPAWSPDGKFLAYEANDVEGRPSQIWVMKVDGSARAQLSPNGSLPRWAPTGRTVAFERQDRRAKGIYVAEAPENLSPGRPLNFVAIMDVNVIKERAQVFEEAWRRIKDSFYDPKMHGVDWAAVKKKYQAMAKNLRTDEELVGVINRMLGELRASHMGFWGPTSRVRNPAPPTGYLGMRLVRTEKDGPRSLTVVDILPGGPADKVWIRPGDHVFEINRKRLGPKANVARLLTGTVGKEIRLRVGAEPRADRSRIITLKPVSWGLIRSLRYARWVKKCQSTVKKTTRGKVGYIHLSMMGARNLEQFKAAVAGPLAKTQGLILDVRNNGGGNIHQELLDILTRRPFGAFHPRGGKRTVQPRLYYTKPVVVLINERSFSDAEVFPYGFKALRRGKLVGVPTNGGVIGTGSATLINGFTLRLPRVGWYGLDGTNLEGHGVKPDFLVPETPEDRMKDRDPQLLKAIEVIQGEIRGTGTPAKKAVPKAKEDPAKASEEEY